MYYGIKRILSLLKSYQKEAFLSVLFNALSSIFSLFSLLMVVPFLGILFNPPSVLQAKPELALNSDALKDYIEYAIGYLVIEFGAISALIWVCVILTINSLFKNIFRYAAQFVLTKIRYGIIRDLRNTIFSKLVFLPIRYFTEKKKGDVYTRITADVQEVEASMLSVLGVYFKEPITILIFLVSLFIISWELTLIVILLTPISGLLVGRIAKKLKRNQIQSQQIISELNSIIEETLSGLRIISGFAAEKFQIDRFRKMNQQHFNVSKKVRRQHALSSPVSEFLGTSIVTLVLFLGSYMVINGTSELSAEAFIGYLIVFSQIINPAKQFSGAYFNLTKGLASLDRIEELLAEEQTIDHTRTYTPIPNGNQAIEFRNVSFAYSEDKIVLQNLNLIIPFGSSIALVGKSGAGKSTFADLLIGFYAPTSGNILYGGTSIQEFNPMEWRALFGIVGQDAFLFNDTIESNIRFGRKLNNSEIQSALQTANATDFIDASTEGIETQVGDRGSRLSGGQRQRITIARAVAAQPKILVLDEATSALDTESEHFVQEALESILQNRTSCIIAHRLSTVRNVHTILVLEAGNIIEKGSHSELIDQNGMYAAMVRNQSL